MITKKTRHGLAALILLTSISFWVAREQRDESPGPEAGLDPKLNYVLREFELQVYDASGQPALNMKAPVLTNDPILEIGTIENPSLVLHQQHITWNLVADSATITADKEHIELSGRVYVQRLEIMSGNRVDLNTENMHITVATQTASTVQPVSLFDGHNQMDAVGMDLDMLNDTFQFKRQVKAIYAVN